MRHSLKRKKYILLSHISSWKITRNESHCLKLLLVHSHLCKNCNKKAFWVIHFKFHYRWIILSEKAEIRNTAFQIPCLLILYKRQQSCLITVYLHCMDWAFFDHFNKFKWDLFLMMFVIWRKSKNEFNPKWNMFDPFVSMNLESITNIQN